MSTHLLPATEWRTGDYLMREDGPHQILGCRVEGVPGRAVVTLDNGQTLRVPVRDTGKIRRAG